MLVKQHYEQIAHERAQMFLDITEDIAKAAEKMTKVRIADGLEKQGAWGVQAANWIREQS